MKQVTIKQSDTCATSCESQSAQRLVGQAFWMFWISNTYGSYIVNSCVKQVLITFDELSSIKHEYDKKKTVVKCQGDLSSVIYWLILKKTSDRQTKI